MRNGFILILTLLGLGAITASALEKNGRVQPVVEMTGGQINFTSVSISSTATTALFGTSEGRSRMTCYNYNQYTIYVGTYSSITAAGVGTYVLNTSTNTVSSILDTTSSAAIWAISQTGPATGTAYSLPVLCKEER